jgi:hypothetical protein
MVAITTASATIHKVTERDMSSRVLEDLGWAEFLPAVQDLVHAGCCGAGLSGAWTARGRASVPCFARIGYAAWRQSVKAAAPILPVQSAPVVLPAVTIVEPERANRENVDVHVKHGRIHTIVPAGSPLAERATVIEEVRGHFLWPALADMHIHNPPSNVFRLTPLFLLLHLRHGVVRLREAGDTDGTGSRAARTGCPATGSPAGRARCAQARG